MSKSQSDKLIGHGSFECQHGFVVKSCQCLNHKKVTVVSCALVPAHGQRLEAAIAAEEEAHPLHVVTADGFKITKVARAYPTHFTYDELQILDDALAYYVMCYPFDMDPAEEYTTSDVQEVLNQVSALRKVASELEPL
jgi:hypothetical protein